MSPKKNSPTGLSILRQKAETALTITRAQVKKMKPEEVQRLVHELQVHQIELEMQNEELRQTQVDLEVARDRYATLFDFSPVGYVTFDEIGRILEANLTFCHLLGLPRKDILRKKFEKYVAPEDQRALRLYLEALKKKGGIHPSDVLTLQHSPTSLRVRLEGCLETMEPPGMANLFRIAVEDVTRWEQMETAQEEQKALMELVVSGVRDAIVTTDEDQRIVLFNKGAENMFGCPVSSALGQSINRFIPERFREAHHKHHRQFVQNPELVRHMGAAREIFGLRVNGEEFPAEGTISQVEMKGKGKGRKLFTVVLRDITERRQAEETIKKEQQFISAILETTESLMAVADTQGNIIQFNHACEKLSGFSLEEVQRRPFWEILIPPTGVEEVKAYFQSLIRGEAPSVYENYWVTKDGTLRWIAWSNGVLRNEHGEVELVFGTGIDLTKQRKVQKALKKEQQFISNVLDTAGALVVILDPRWHILRINRLCEQTVRYSFEDLKDQPIWNLWVISGEDDQEVREALESYKTGRLPVAFETAILDKAGQLRWIQWNTTATYHKNGAVENYIATGIDITARKHAERLLQQNEEQLQAILDHSPVAIWLKDLAGRYLKVNRQFEKNVGLSEGEIIGKTDSQIFSAKQAAEIGEHDQTVFQSGKAHEFDKVSERLDGVHTEHVFKFLVTTPKGKPYALCGIATDITRRKQAEANLWKTSQRMEIQQEELRLLASQLLMAQEQERRRISRDLHDDVNQRLALLSLKLQSAEKGLPDRNPVKHMIQELYENVAELSDDIRHLAYQYHPSILDDLGLGTALRSLCEDFAKWERLSVTWELPDGRRKFSQTVATCLYRVVQESLRNVSRHAKASAVHLVLRQDRQKITLSICDNGRGFNLDERLSQGLGFVSMRERVNLVGGKLRVDSHSGRGTTVKVSIPNKANV